MNNNEKSIQAFKDFGCNKTLTEKLLHAQKNDDIQQQTILLASHRKDLLDMLHKYQRYIDCLDYYVYYLTKTEKNQRGL